MRNVLSRVLRACLYVSLFFSHTSKAGIELTQTLYGHKGGVVALAWHPNVELYHLIASASDDKTVKIWNWIDGKCLQTISPGNVKIRAIDFCPHCDDKIALGCDKGIIQVWNWIENKLLKTIQVPPSSVTKEYGNVMHIAWNQLQPKTLAVCTDEKCASRVYDMEQETAIELPNDWLVYCSAWHPSLSNKIATGSSAIKIWDYSHALCEKTLPENNQKIRCLSWNQNRETLLASTSLDNTIKLWDISKGTCVGTLKDSDDVFTCISWHPAGSCSLVSAGYNGTIKLWWTEKQCCVDVYKGAHQQKINAIAWHQSWFEFFATCSDDETIKIWCLSKEPGTNID